MNQRNRIEIPCELTEGGLKKLKDKVSTELFPIIEGKREDYTFVFDAESSRIDVMYKGDRVASITKDFWARIVDIKPPQHYDD